jgi:DNA repair exonuclease SbcCD nuclease subunit
MFKFIHAADLHLDSPLLGLDRYEGAPVEAIRGATRKAFSKLVRLAMDERVAFVILAGDIYDGDWPDYNTGLFFIRELRELDKAGIPVVLIRGNHDAESRITSRLTFPANSRELPTNRPDTIMFEKYRVAVHGQGYAHQAETRNLAEGYPSPISGYFNIGVLHTALDGREPHAPYAPCKVEQLVAHGYDYWALGHVHCRDSVSGQGRVRIEFPGNTQGRTIRETGAKGCLIVTVDESGLAHPEFRALDVFRWTEVVVEATSAASMEDAVDLASKAIDDARQGADERPLAARIRVACTANVYAKLAVNLEQFRFELAARAGDQVWIERIKLSQPEETVGETPAFSGDAASELRRTLAEFRSDPEMIKAVFAVGDCGKLRKVLPEDLRNILDATDHDDIFDRASVLLSTGSGGEGE